jgi:preprotein translocase subunit Sss1
MAIIRLKQLAWFVGLWAAGVAAVGLVGFAIRLMLHN